MAKPSFETTRNSAIAALYCLAYTIDLQIREGAGASILNLQPDLPWYEWPRYEDIDCDSIDVLAGLEAIYRYAIHGETRGWISEDIEEGNLGRLEALVEMVSNNLVDRNWGDFEHVAGENDRGELLHQVVKLAKARHQLDSERYVELGNIALLAGMNERSVRNALHAKGDGHLIATRGAAGELVVEKLEALRWLRRGHGFIETRRIGSPMGELPEKLERDEIMPYLRERLRLIFPNQDRMYEQAASNLGVTADHLRGLFCGDIEEFSPEHCPMIADILLVDTQWLTTQVMRARFPEAMKQIEPAHPATASLQFSPFNEEAGTLDVVLTDAGIRNGYLDIESRYADRFFPADSFGGRGGDEKAAEIVLHHDQKKSPYMTDLRVKSKALVSPRKRFNGYFSAHAAKAGDVVRIKRLGERSYELIYIGQ